MENYKVVNEEVNHDDVIVTINDYYENSEHYACVVPVAESFTPVYNVVKDKAENPADVYHTVNYEV